MANYQIHGPSIKKHSVTLSPPIAQGAAGTIHQIIGEPGIVAKLYINPKDLPEYEEKVAAMLAAPPNLPPFSYNSRPYIQIAWPLGIVSNGRGDFLGFVMPEVDIRASTELENVLQKAMRARKNIPEFYGTRILLAANLAALMAELHGLGHYMVDMKPVNLRFYPHAWYMAILDTDGFSIAGQQRFPAHQFSDEYIAPEALNQKPETLGLQQDLFALATIIFRLFNNGLHPFQGVDLVANQPTTLQDRVFARLYPYGLTPHGVVKPAPQSIHAYIEDDTRQLFDRAFLSNVARPTASEWRDHLGDLINNKRLMRCKVSKDHAHFSKGCGLCAVTKANIQRPPAFSPQPLSGSTQFGPSVITSLPTGSGNIASATFTDWIKNNPKKVAATVGIMLLLAWLLIPSQRATPSLQPTTASAPTYVPSSPPTSTLEPVPLPPASTAPQPVQPPTTSMPKPAASAPTYVPSSPPASTLEPVPLPPRNSATEFASKPPVSTSLAPVPLPPDPSSLEPVPLPNSRF